MERQRTMRRAAVQVDGRAKRRHLSKNDCDREGDDEF
jgi:hypothetical protein